MKTIFECNACNLYSHVLKNDDTNQSQSILLSLIAFTQPICILVVHPDHFLIPTTRGRVRVRAKLQEMPRSQQWKSQIIQPCILVIS